MANTVNNNTNDAELKVINENIKTLYTKVAEMQESMATIFEALEELTKQKVKVKKDNIKKEVKPVESHKLVTIKKVIINDREAEVNVYENFVVIEGHKRKIYDVKKGRLFTYEGKPVYLNFNSLQAV